MMRLFLCQLAVVFSLSSCITLKEPQVKTINNLNAEGLLSGHPKISFDVVVYNPNSIGITMTDFKVNVSYGSQSLANLETSSDYYAAPMADATIPLSIEPSMEQMNTFIQSGLAGLGSSALSKVNGTGSVKVRKFFISKTFYFNF